jgi:hypothetical protein
MKQEHLEGLALQLVRMRRTVKGLLTTLNALSPAIEIAIQQLEPKCRRYLLNHGVLNECRCKDQETSHMKSSGAGECWPR